MCAEASTILRAVAADFFFNGWYLEIPSDNSIRTYQCASTILRKAFDWKRLRISMLEVEAVPQSYSASSDCFKYGFIYEKFVVTIYR
jgi:hypothetical protein